MTDIQDRTGSSREQADEALQRFADGFSYLRRSPVLHSLAKRGLDYEDITFPARDGVPLEGWFIPAPGSGKLIIANHPMGFSRSSMPANVQPWHADWAPSGNGFEVDLVPDYKILHDAGYNVLAYDLRNHGFSSAANGGVTTHGVTESRDVAGSLAYARTRPGTRDMVIGLFSRCMGGVSTFAAMTRFPAAFDWVRCPVSPQPVTPRYIVQRRLALIGLGGRLDDFDILIRLRTSVGLGQRIPQSGPGTCACRLSSARSAAASSLTPVTSRRCSTTSRWPRRSCTGSRTPRPGSTASWSSSAARSPCSTGSRSTCADLARRSATRVSTVFARWPLREYPPPAQQLRPHAQETS